MKKKVLFIFLFSSLIALSQEKFSKEISFITDNDLYTSTYDDRYYTNGMFLSFKYLAKKMDNSLDKKILEWQVGHEMFTPAKANTENINEHDRPFAGYLFGAFSINRVYKNKQNFKTTIQLGVIGPNAYAMEMQNFIHNIYGFKKAEGWKYQIKSALGINFDTDYNRFITKNKSNHLDLTWVNSAKLGTVYTNISTGLYTRIGFKPLQSFANSIAFNTNINNKNNSYYRESEAFIFIKPTIRYAIYDATLQGSFLNKGSEITNELESLIFHIQAGFKFTVNRLNFGYTFNYNTNKSKGLKFDNGHKYGSININYLIR
ncbi:lipid A deacylase LpxR family protein [uncultured Polaribacter sp.]|uniref:lipid A deacylase LpxR family protein n=1 Tax=uncultured Polaribacter sp. TaxID=174711 RepID=UPI00260F6E8F|nr:lipid A deacylase LpxR family protein [uncultured Polaribacter sp.]